MIDPQLTITAQIAPADLQFLDDQINEFNFSTTGIHDGELLTALIRDAYGNIAAGVYGWTWGGCCEVRYLWVREDWRGQGYGRRLLAAAEAEAARRGCSQVVLSTHSFQAPAFYQAHGYVIVGQYDEYPRGYKQYFLRKELKGVLSMDKKELDSLVKQVHTELDKADSLNEAQRDSLRALVNDTQAHFERPQGNPPEHKAKLIEGLEEAMTQFEVSHPVLTQAISQILNGLADAGV